MSSTLEITVLAAYYAVLVPLALFGLHRFWLLWLLRRRSDGSAEDRVPTEPPTPAEDGWPTVTVQLPVFNERFVGPRLLAAVAQLDYPKDRLEIQVLDDSTDDTTELLRAQVDELVGDGLDVKLLHRERRDGYKAGALALGLASARGALVAVFDADFVPTSDFLRRTVPRFAEPGVGMVQACWGHLNREYSLLTRIQALLLDGHFLIEHHARSRSGRFFNFNGTAGIWRRQTIEDAGGWQHDTLTEDLDLSYRAQLRGWRFVFLPDLVVPAELPIDVDAFRSQQRRWTRGSAQSLRKLGGRMLSAPLPLPVKLEALVHLCANLAYPLMVALTILMPVAMWMRRDLPWSHYLWLDLPLLVGATGSVTVFYLEAARRAGCRPGVALLLQPALMALGIGMSWHNARAALGGLVKRGGEFERTPKVIAIDGESVSTPSAYLPRRRTGMVIEPMLAIYLGVVLSVAAWSSAWWALPFTALFFAGYSYVMVLRLGTRLSARGSSTAGC